MTVVVPAFNAGDALRRALDSCLAQTTPPNEIIVVDDGSTDGAVDRVEAWWRARPTLMPLRVLRQPNTGPASARNRGWDAAGADLVAFLDADDAWVPEKLARVLAAWPGPDTVAVGHGHFVRGRAPGFSARRVQRLSLPAVIARNPFTTPSLVVRRETPLRFDPSFRHAEDHDLIVRLTAHGPVYRLDEPLVELGREPLSPGGLSANRLAMRAGELRLYARLWRLRWWLGPMVPALVMLSMAKHLLGIARGAGRPR